MVPPAVRELMRKEMHVDRKGRAQHDRAEEQVAAKRIGNDQGEKDCVTDRLMYYTNENGR